MSARGLTVAVLVSICALAVGAVPAGAATGYGPFSSFTSANGELASPAGTAVDNSTGPSAGDVYVVDIGHARLLKFNSAGVEENFSALGTPEIAAGFTQLRYVAVDGSSGSSKGDIYISDTEGHAVYKYNPAGELVSKIEGSTVGAANFRPTGLAVNPTNGELFIGGLEPSVIYATKEESPGKWKLLTTFGEGEVAGVDSIAADSAGNVYVTDEGTDIREFSPAGLPVICPSGTAHEGTNVVDTSSPQSVAVDPSNNDIFVGERNSQPNFQIAEYSAPCSAPITEFGEGDFGEAGSFGIAVSGTTHNVYGSLIAGTTADLFTAGPKPPKPTTDPIPGGEVVGLKATLEGEVIEGESSYFFAYNTGSSCTGGSTTASTPATGTVKVSAEITGLQPSIEYAFCLVSKNEFGQSFGATQKFKVKGFAPTHVVVNPATEVRKTSAVLHGEFNPEGSATKVYFEYGLEPCATAKTACVKTAEEGPVTSFSQQMGTATVEGLTPYVTYFDRVVAVNSTKTVISENESTFIPGLPSEIRTEPAIEVTETGAELNGEFNANGTAKYYFEYGTSPCGESTCGTKTVEGKNPVMGEKRKVIESIAVGSLTPNTTYFFWVVAVDPGGTVHGEQRTFTTILAATPPPPPITGPPSAGIATTTITTTPTTTTTLKSTTPPKKTTKKKTLTRAQRLAKALRECAKKQKHERIVCQKQVGKQFSPRKHPGPGNTKPKPGHKNKKQLL